MSEAPKKETSFYDYISILKDIFYSFWRRKWIILALSIAFAGVSFYYFRATRKPVQYIATSTFMLYDSDKGISSLNSILGQSSSSGTSNKELIIYLLGSRRIIEDMLLSEAYFMDTTNLIVYHYARITGLMDQWKTHPILNNYRFSKKPERSYVDFQDSVLGILVGRIASQESFDIDQKSWKMSITYKNDDEHFAKLIVEKQIEALCQFYIARKKTKGMETSEFLERKRDSLAVALRAKEFEFAAWKDSNQRLIKATGGAEESKYRQEITLISTSFSEASRQLEMAKLTLLDESPIVQTIDTPKYPLPRAVSSNWKFMAGICSLIGFILISILTVGQKYIANYFKREKEQHIAA